MAIIREEIAAALGVDDGKRECIGTGGWDALSLSSTRARSAWSSVVSRSPFRRRQLLYTLYLAYDFGIAVFMLTVGVT